MRVKRRIFPSPIATLLIAGIVMSAVSPCFADEDTVEDIKRQHQEWKDSFTNLRMVFEWRNPVQWSRRTNELAPGVSLDEYYHRVEWMIADQGWARETSRGFVAGKLTRMMMFGDDGQCSYKADFQNPESMDSAIPTGLSIGQTGLWGTRRSYLGNEQSRPLAGLWFYSRWINEQDQKVPFVIQRMDELDGFRCAVVRQPTTAGFTVWLDLDHDALPRRIEPDKRGICAEYRVEEFRQLPNGHWFPDHGTIMESSQGPEDPYYWTVIEVALNEPSPQSRYGIPKTNDKTRLINTMGAKYSNIPHRRDDAQSGNKPTQPSILSPGAGLRESGPFRSAAANGWFWFLLGSASAMLVVLLLWKLAQLRKVSNK